MNDHWNSVFALCMSLAFALPAFSQESPPEEPSIDARIESLQDADADVRAAAAKALGAMGSEAEAAIPALLEALKDEGYTTSEEPVWMVACGALGDIGLVAKDELIAALQSDNPRTVRGAAGALHRLGPAAKEAVPVLIEVLRRDVPGTRGPAIHGLIGLGAAAEPATAALVDALSHEVFHVRYWACQALAAIGPGAKAAVPALSERLREGLPSVRRHAAIALGRIGPDIGQQGLNALIDALSDKLEPVRADAVVALGRLGPFAQEAVGPLETALAGNVLSARSQAAEAHWRITGSTEVALPVLIGELDRFKSYWLATESLARMGPAAKPVVATMKEVMEKSEPEVREAIEEALKSIEAP